MRIDAAITARRSHLAVLLVGTFRTCRDGLTMSAHRGILLQKSFWGRERKFLEPLMRLARSDVRTLSFHPKSTTEASYGRYGVLQWQSRLKISFCEHCNASPRQIWQSNLRLSECIK